jgi:hypothetical protein
VVIDKYVRLPVYTQDGKETGEVVEIPLMNLRNAIIPIRVFDKDMRIIKVTDVRD